MLLHTHDTPVPISHQAPFAAANHGANGPSTPEQPAPSTPVDDGQLLADPQDLEDLEFLLDEIEDQIAPLA
jgi:hypothetical protein